MDNREDKDLNFLLDKMEGAGFGFVGGKMEDIYNNKWILTFIPIGHEFDNATPIKLIYLGDFKDIFYKDNYYEYDLFIDNISCIVR